MKTFLKRCLVVTVFLLLALGWLLLPGCSTTTAPKPIRPAQASFDAVADAKGNNQNSGVLGFTNHQAVITPTARARYNALCERWGKKFTPPVVPPDAGLTPLGTNLWLMNKDALDKWATMTTWQAQPPAVVGIKPP